MPNEERKPIGIYIWEGPPTPDRVTFTDATGNLVDAKVLGMHDGIMLVSTPSGPQALDYKRHPREEDGPNSIIIFPAMP